MITALVAALGLPALTTGAVIWGRFAWHRRVIKVLQAWDLDLATATPEQRARAEDALRMHRLLNPWP